MLVYAQDLVAGYGCHTGVLNSLCEVYPSLKGQTAMATKDNDMSFASPPVIDDATLDQLMAQIDAKGLHLLGPDPVLTQLTSAIMNRAMQAELINHMGYKPGDPAGGGLAAITVTAPVPRQC